jgi:AcrR family transcriptional regulator
VVFSVIDVFMEMNGTLNTAFSQMPRSYELKKRAEAQAETRRRIVEATVALHEEVGPARTTVAEIARRAGVTRLTVYNHFPEDAALFGACSGHWVANNRPPDPTPWAAIDDPDARLHRALLDTYAWFDRAEPMLTHVERDRAVLPALDQVVTAGRAPYAEAVRSILLRDRRGKKAAAAIALALDFHTWRRLVRLEGLSPAAAADVMVAATRSSG